MKRRYLLGVIILAAVSLNGLISSEKGDVNMSKSKSEDTKIIKQIKPYLMFPGTCRQALGFYKKCFDGEIVMMQTFEESPVDVPEELKNRIFNSEFRADNLCFMASDDLPGNEVKIGSNFALFVIFSDKIEKEKVFKRISEGGKVLFPMEENFGMLVDKFGIQWMFESQ